MRNPECFWPAAAGCKALLSEDGFYEEIFSHLRLSDNPVRWVPDRNVSLPGATRRTAEIAKEAAILQLTNPYRVRGHLIADRRGGAETGGALCVCRSLAL